MREATPSDGVHLVTGTAGFIGFHLTERLLQEGRQVVGIDNMNDYYDPALKEARLQRLGNHEGFVNYRIGLEDRDAVMAVFDAAQPRAVVNLAAQAGVRYSLENPQTYIDSNIVGFGNILEACRKHEVGHLVYASSSSVYGLNTKMPFAVGDTVDHPASLYAASKKSNELMAHTYSHLFGIPTTGLRFFTVYGPWGRPDMALFLFTRAILAGEPINVFNNGQMQRDFTYIDDIVEGVILSLDNPPEVANGSLPHRLYNIGNHRSEPLMKVINVIEESIGKKAMINFRPMQQGDIKETFADITAIKEDLGFDSTTPIEVGIPKFVEWFRLYEQVNS